MAIKVNNDTVIFDDRTLKVSSGTERPTSPVVGTLWYNESEGLEVFDGAEWRPITEIPPPPPVVALAWGWGNDGRLGTDNLIARSSPVSVVGGITDWTEISAGQNHNLAQRSDGSLWAWGLGSYGRLGDNAAVNRSSPVSVVGGITDWEQISAGALHSLALRSEGTIWAWGNGVNGRLGTNDQINRSSPVSVAGGITDWEQISAGGGHNLALRSNGTLWAWGYNGQGRLGINNTIARLSPVSVVGGITDWTEISAGRDHSLAIRSNGTLWAWGSGADGRLGINNTFNRSSPVSVVGGITDWTEISAGQNHNLAQRSDGSLWSWGSGANGRLGDNAAVNRSSPVSVVGGITNWTEISASGYHSLALRSEGTIWAWGLGSYGRLGTNDIIDRSSPTLVSGGITNWTEISAGYFHNLALRISEE